MAEPLLNVTVYDGKYTQLAAAKVALNAVVWKYPDDACYYTRYTEDTDLTSDVRAVLEAPDV